ncbi:MAG: hypothetical protein V3R69_07850 [candidate division NC10 bacterium]
MGGPKKSRRRAPKKFPPLFVGTAERWWLNASLNWLPESVSVWALDLYAEGYREAAEHLGRAAARRRSTLTIDAVICPLVFLWRHYLEIRLKEIIISASALLGKHPIKPERTHNLNSLWKKARPLLEKALNLQDGALLQADTIIKEFHNHDPTSQGFRYEVDKDGNPSPPTVTQINVSNLNRQMMQLARFLEGTSFAISVYADLP